MEEVNKSNKQLEQHKHEMKETELEEQRRIAEYLKAKDANEQACDYRQFSPVLFV